MTLTAEIDFADPGQCEGMVAPEYGGHFGTIPMGEPTRCPNPAVGWTLQGVAACVECHAKHAGYGCTVGCPNLSRTTTVAAS